MAKYIRRAVVVSLLIIIMFMVTALTISTVSYTVRVFVQ